MRSEVLVLAMLLTAGCAVQSYDASVSAGLVGSGDRPSGASLDMRGGNSLLMPGYRAYSSSNEMLIDRGDGNYDYVRDDRGPGWRERTSGYTRSYGPAAGGIDVYTDPPPNVYINPRTGERIVLYPRR